MSITVELLEEIGACDDGLDAFEARFPHGVATWEACVKAANTALKKVWLAWLGRHCPAEVEGSTWEARLAVQRDDGERAALGRFCPTGVAGATFEARMTLQGFDTERAYLIKKREEGEYVV